jgi:hypothetical protein
VKKCSRRELLIVQSRTVTDRVLEKAEPQILSTEAGCSTFVRKLHEEKSPWGIYLSLDGDSKATDESLE